MVPLHLIHTLSYPERSSGGKDMGVVSPNDDIGAARLTFFWIATLSHVNCHGGYGP